MGSNGSKLVKKIVSPFNSSSNPSVFSDCVSQPHLSETSKTMAGPIVLSRQGSMFFDEDGDLAHEFYEEVKPNKRGSKAKMKRIQTNLVPQFLFVLDFIVICLRGSRLCNLSLELSKVGENT